MKLQTTITRQSNVDRTARLQQVQGMFDLPDTTVSAQSWEVLLNLPAAWSIGVIVGASGDGKSTVARWLAEAFHTRLIGGKDADGNELPAWTWAGGKSLLDGFPAGMSIHEITGLLSSVGFSSPPAWVRPFHVLSNGQQFRVNLARTLAECPEVAIVDEFTSVVDRKVAQIGSAAVAKTIRRRKQKFIAVTCHYDVLDWLEADWVYEPATNTLTLNADSTGEPTGDAGRSVRPGEAAFNRWQRPAINLRIAATPRETWARFRQHHYLNHELHRSARCFVGTIDGEPAAFTAALHFPTVKGLIYREHRTVCLPDYQGVGIGNRMSEQIAAVFAATGVPYHSLTSHPAMIRHRMKSPLWRCLRRPGMVDKGHTGLAKADGIKRANSAMRISASFRYAGQPDPRGATLLGVMV